MRKRIPKEYLGAFKNGHRKSAREFIDEELATKLLERVERGCLESEKALVWLTKFNNEYYKSVIDRDDPKAFHKTRSELTECDARKYRQQMDMFSYLNRTKTHGGEDE